MSRFFLSCVLLTLALFGLSACNEPSGISTDSNNIPSNANSAVQNSSNANIGGNANQTNSGNAR